MVSTCCSPQSGQVKIDVKVIVASNSDVDSVTGASIPQRPEWVSRHTVSLAAGNSVPWRSQL
jgi:hypothetical protein